MNKRRIVVTGLGMITPLGITVAETWQNIIAGKSGVTLLDDFRGTDYPSQIAAQVKNFDITAYLEAKNAKKVDIFVQYAVAAAAQALHDCQIDLTTTDVHRIGVAVGSGIGGLLSISKNHAVLMEKGPRRISPYFIPGTIINMAAGYIAINHRLKGPNISIVTACTTGAHNIGYAARTIAYGDADMMLAGGTEMASIPLSLGGFAALRALSTRNHEPAQASRPWDKDRDGFVLGDGAGVLMLEEYQHAKARSATIYAELAGFGMSGDGATSMTSPEHDGMLRAIHNGLRDAQLNPADIQYINAHATSTVIGDPMETQAIRSAFGASASKVAISSTKSMTGHLLGAAGAVEAIFSILAIRDQIAPPTINLDHPEAGCDLDFVPKIARTMKINAVLSNSFGFGGTNASLIFKKI